MPVVSIGLIVFNGEKYLRFALESILNQDYKDFELIISDNASTDQTETICLEYKSIDSRIKYYRNKTNIGSIKNYNQAFSLSTGKYFLWASHDDIWEKTYLGKCVKTLDENPSSVMCCSKVIFIDKDGYEIPELNNNVMSFGIDTSGMEIPERFHQLLNRACWTSFYGLIRRNVLEKVLPLPDVYGMDNILLVRLLLQGEFIKIPEFLFFYRYIPKKYNDYCEMLLFSGTKSENTTSFVVENMIKSVMGANLDEKVKLKIKKYLHDYFYVENTELFNKILKEYKNSPEKIKDFLNYFSFSETKEELKADSENILVADSQCRIKRTIRNMIIENPLDYKVTVISTVNNIDEIKSFVENIQGQSIFEQTEIIIINFSDDTKDYINNFKSKFSNIKSIGLPKSRNMFSILNETIKSASGDYIIFVNQGNRLKKDALKIMADELDNREVAVLVYSNLYITEEINFDLKNMILSDAWISDKWDRNILLKYSFIGPMPMWKKSVHEIYGYFDEKSEESADYEFWLKISQTNDFHYIPLYLGLYYDSPEKKVSFNTKRLRKEFEKVQQNYNIGKNSLYLNKSEAEIISKIHFCYDTEVPDSIIQEKKYIILTVNEKEISSDILKKLNYLFDQIWVPNHEIKDKYSILGVNEFKIKVIPFVSDINNENNFTAIRTFVNELSNQKILRFEINDLKKELFKNGLQKLEEEKFTEAEKYFQDLSFYDEKNPVVYYYIGFTQYHQEKYKEAIDNFSKCIKLNMINHKICFTLGKCLEKIGQKDIAEIYFRKAGNLNS